MARIQWIEGIIVGWLECSVSGADLQARITEPPFLFVYIYEFLDKFFVCLLFFQMTIQSFYQFITELNRL